MSDLDFDKDLEIDPDNLDRCLLDQPQLYMKWGRLCAEAEKEAKMAELKKRQAKSELIKDVKLNPENYGVSNPTEKIIEACVVIHPKYVHMKEKVIEAESRFATLSVAKTAFLHRREALHDLVQLYVTGYWQSVNKPLSAPERDRLKDEKEKIIDAQIKGSSDGRIKKRVVE